MFGVLVFWPILQAHEHRFTCGLARGPSYSWPRRCFFRLYGVVCRIVRQWWLVGGLFFTPWAVGASSGCCVLTSWLCTAAARKFEIDRAFRLLECPLLVRTYPCTLGRSCGQCECLLAAAGGVKLQAVVSKWKSSRVFAPSREHLSCSGAFAVSAVLRAASARTPDGPSRPPACTTACCCITRVVHARKKKRTRSEFPGRDYCTGRRKPAAETASSRGSITATFHICMHRPNRDSWSLTNKAPRIKRSRTTTHHSQPGPISSIPHAVHLRV